MTFTLFPDQEEFIRNLAIELNRHHSIIGCAATGFGKSKVFIRIADKFKAKESCNSVLIVTESLKIYNQISLEMRGRIIDINADETGLIFIPENSICVAMAQTLSRRPHLLQQLSDFGRNLLMIIDEGHVGTQNNVIKELTNARKICFTATPDARWAKHLPEFYNSIVVGPQPEELVRLGRLTPYKHFARVSADLTSLAVKGGEFTEESQEKAFGTAQVFDGLAEDLRTISHEKCLIFCASIADCEMEFDRLTNAGFSCVRSHTNRKILSDAEDVYGLSQFIKGNVPICVSVGTLTKGFDFPMIDLIVLRRATTSLPLYLQMCGRGSRVWKEGVNGFDSGVHKEKKGWVVLDYGQNFMRFGLWDMDREWGEVWNKPNKPREGVAPVKLCPRCEYIMPNTASICPNCGFELVKNIKELEPGKLIEITDQYTKRCVGKRFSQLIPEELAIYANFKNKKSFAARIAKSIDQDKPGYLEKYAAAMGYKPSWPDVTRRMIKEDEKISFQDFVLK
jgi:superfamily II DNA or RNA helicase